MESATLQKKIQAEVDQFKSAQKGKHTHIFMCE